MRRLKISLVVPAFNSAESFSELLDSIKQALRKRDELDYEIIFVNDCSPDDVWKLILEESRRNSRVKGIDLSRNLGQHTATIIGFKHATGDFVVTIDDDLQYPPSYIIDLITSAIENSFDVVYGVPVARKNHKLWKNLGSKLNHLVLSLILKKSPKIHVSSFRILRRSLYGSIASIEDNEVYLDSIIFQATSKIGNVPIRLDRRKFGHSNYDISKSTKLFWLMLKSSYYTPRKILAKIGVSVAILGLALLLYVVFKSMEGAEDWPLGWASIFGISLLSFGIQSYFLSSILAYTVNRDRREQFRGFGFIRQKVGF